MEEMNFEQALDFYLSLLEDEPEGISSISISFYEDWTGEKHNYTLDTLYPAIDPRVHSLNTAYVIDHVELPRKREDLTDELVANLVVDFRQRFSEANKAIEEVLASESTKEV